MARANFVTTLDRLIEAAPQLTRATAAVTERWARRRLELNKDEPLVYRGLALRCIGSKRWRDRQ